MAKSSFAARVKQKAKEAEFSGGNDTLRVKDGVGFFKPKKGKNEIIILPFEMAAGKNIEDIKPGDLWFRQQIFKHFRVGPDDKAVICPRTVGKKCPICEHRATLLAQGRTNDDEEVKELMPKKRELYYVIDLQDEDNKTKIFETSYHTFGKKLEEEIREADDDSLAVNFADLDDGAVVVVRMSEASLGKNKFLEATRFDFEERSKAEQKLVANAAEDVVPFGDIMVVPTYEELKRLFYDLDPDDAEDGGEGRSGRGRGREKDDGEEDKSRSGRSRPHEPEGEGEEDTQRSGRGRSSRDKDDGEGDEPEEGKSRSGRGRNRDRDKEEGGDDGEEDKPRGGRSKPKDKDEDGGEGRSGRGRGKSGKDKDEPECPGDGTYGRDCDKLDACEDCAFWADCRDVTDDYEANKGKK